MSKFTREGDIVQGATLKKAVADLHSQISEERQLFIMFIQFSGKFDSFRLAPPPGNPGFTTGKNKKMFNVLELFD